MVPVLPWCGVMGPTDGTAGHRQPLSQEHTQTGMPMMPGSPSLGPAPSACLSWTLHSGQASLQLLAPSPLARILCWATVICEKLMTALCLSCQKTHTHRCPKGHVQFMGFTDLPSPHTSARPGTSAPTRPAGCCSPFLGLFPLLAAVTLGF